MSLIKCPECGKEISDKAEKCPHCNLDIKKYNQKLEEEKQEAERQKNNEEEKRKAEEQKKLKELESKEKCPECGVLIDKGIEKCTNCGFPIKEEKARIKIEKDNEKKRTKKLIVAGIGIVILLCISLFVINKYYRTLEYKKAITLLKNGDLYEAQKIFKQIQDYKNSKELLEAVNVGLKMKPIIRESKTNDFWFSDDIYIQSIGDILEKSDDFKELDQLREEMVNGIKSVLDYPLSNKYEEYYNDVEYLINCINKYTDTKALTSELENLRVIEMLKYMDKNENYDEVAKAINELDELNENVQYLADLYMDLYSKYGKFVGKYHTFEFKITYDWTDLYKNEDDIYFQIIQSGRHLDNQDKNGDTGCCYSNLYTEGDRMSFYFHTGGIGSQDDNVILEIIDELARMTINGTEIKLTTISESENSNNRYNEVKEPYIGMSAYDAEYHCTWGEPTDKNITETEYGKIEQWVYKGYGYLYIQDGKVKTIQK